MPLYSYKGIRPKLGKNVYIAPNASVIGDVEIGDDSSIWFGVVVRGDVHSIRIGARTNIQDNAVIHVTTGRSPATIGSDVTVGHLALLHGCTVGNGCLIGMGSIVLDDAVIGDEAFVAAGALVSPKTIVPARALMMGRPARVVRTLTDADLEGMRSGVAEYVQNARIFASEVEPV